MRRLPLLSFALVFAGLVTASGCTVGSPTTTFGHDTGNDDRTDMAGTNTPPTPTPDMAPPLTVPQPATFALTSVYTTVPIHGTTSPPYSAVLIMAMDGTTTSADVDGSGRFCADLVLQQNKTNVFQLWTHDNNSGRESASVTVQVTQAGQPASGQQSANSINGALGDAATSYQIGVNGTAPAQQVTDGDPTTWIEAAYDTPWFSSPQPGVVVQLTQATSINKIVAVLPSDCPIDGTLKLAYSAQSAPAQPADNAAGWVPVTVTKSADGFTWSASFNAASATSIAAWWSTDSGGCNGGYVDPESGASYTSYGLAELQAWTTPGAVQPPQSPPMCGL